MTVVSDTGPLVALAKVGQLNLLRAIFWEVHIPPAVHRELLAKYGPEAARLERTAGFPQACTVANIAACSCDRDGAALAPGGSAVG